MKKMGKKIISLLLAAMIIFGSVAAGVAELDFAGIFSSAAETANYSGSCGYKIYWKLDTSTGVLNITGTGPMEYYFNTKAVPWYSNRNYIKTVSIENGLTSIENYAFYDCDYLTSITIPDSVTSIGDNAFWDCRSLVNIEIPDGVTSIGKYAFYTCDSLTSVTIGNSVASIGVKAFGSCNSLASITVSPANETYSSDEYGVLFNKNKTELIQYPIGYSRTNYAIPNGVTSIGDNAFYDCRSLVNIEIPDSVTSIGSSAFYQCALGSVTFGKNSQLTTIGYSAFYNCFHLTSIEIPDSVTSIGESAFENCYKLTSVTIGNSVTSIGESVFADCFNLTSVTFGNSVTSIGVGAFYDCRNLVSIEIPDSVTSIGSSAFGTCDRLTSITIGNSVSSIGYNVFGNCDRLTSITVNLANETYSSDEYGVLFNKNTTELVQYPIGNTRTNYLIPNGVTSIGKYAFDGCTNLTSIEIPDGVTSIGDRAFNGCTNLTSIEIPSSVTSIDGYAFSYCKSLEYVHIPTSVTTIGTNILYNTSAYICSTTEDCYAKTYADANRIKFKVCTGHGENGHTHSYTEYRTEPTCQKFGYIFYLCSCGDHYMELLPKVDHSWKLVSTVEATCTEPGYEVYECQFEGCGETKTVEIGAKNHNFPANNAEYVEPTCTEDGYWILRCVACGEEQIKVNPGSKTGHDFGDGEIVKAPSCNEGGVIRYTCSCGYSYDEGVAPAHNAMNDGEVTTEPTCTEPGVITYTCTECGEGYTEEIPALGHTLSYKDNGNGTHTVSCSECRYKENENHTLKGRKCICGYTDTSVISVLLIQDNAPWLTDSNEKVLTALEKENYIDSWEICRTNEISEIDLNGYSIVMFANDQGQNAYNNLKKNSAAINAYVEDGGVLIAGACDDGWIDGFLDNSSLPGGLTKSFVLDYNNKIADSDHPIVTGELTDNRELYNNDLYHNYCSHTSFSNIPENANVILTDSKGNATLLEYQYGNGYVIASGLTWEHNMEYHAYSTYYAEKAYEDVIAYAASIAGPADNRYVVRFVDWDGEVLKRERVAYGEAATAPSAPERDGYEFKGWDKEFNAITAHTVVNAVYEINQYNVTVEFDETKGVATGSGKYDFGSGAILEASAISGYNFVGWYEGDILLSTDEIYVYTVPARNVTITASFAKDVPTLSSIRVNTLPAKTTYFVGEGFNRNGLTILATYSDGSTAVIESGFTCTPNVLTQVGNQTITVTYGGKTCTFDVTVADVVLESIEINSLPIKTEYLVGETLVTTGLTLLAKYSNGTEKVISGGFACSPTALNTVGIQKITVTYGGKSCTFDVTVAEKEEAVLIKIEVYQLPDKTMYVVGDKLDTTGLQLKLIYSDGSSKIISNYAFDCTPTLLKTEGMQTITLTYLGFTCTFDVKVLGDIYVEHIPTQNYTGSAIAPEIKVYSTATDARLTEGVDYTVSIRNNINIGTAYVTVTGKGDYESVVNTSFNIIGDVEISKIEIHTLPEKLIYNEGDTLDTDGLVLKVTYTDGSVYYVDSGFICTPTVLNNAGKQIITVIYEGYVCTFEVTVNEKEDEVINVYATYIVDGEVYAIYELEPGEVIPVPVNPEKDGWTFNGWTPEIPENISYDDMTFIAVFTEGAPKFYVNEPLESYEYTGYPIMPAIDVYSTETNEILEEYVDYIINYSNNIDAGVAQVEIVGIGDYDGEVIFSTFIIYARSASNVTISKIPSTYETGSPICVVPIVKDGRFALVKGVDFDLEYANNVNPGTATVTIIFKGNYSGTKTVTFEILEASERFRVIEIPYIVIEIPEIINEFPQIPDWDNIIVCGEDNRVLIEDTDYVIEYPEINGLGMAEIVVKGINDYEGEEFVIVVTVVATDISGIEVNYNETVAYTGNDITLDLDGKVICGNTVLVEGVDYVTEYVNNRNAGTMTVIIIGIGNYSGRTEFEVVIEKADISGMSVSGVSGYYTYNGGEIKPEIILGNLVIGRDYTVTYTNNVNIGTATVIINGIGNYTGEIRITFVITDASTPAPSASVSIISDITSLGYEETAVLETSIVWGDYSRGRLIWTSSDESVATVNSVGVVDVLDEGTVTITVKLCDRNGNIIVDENGNEVADSIRIKCTMTFWQKIVRWFRNLFAALAGIFG